MPKPHFRFRNHLASVEIVAVDIAAVAMAVVMAVDTAADMAVDTAVVMAMEVRIN